MFLYVIQFILQFINFIMICLIISSHCSNYFQHFFPNFTNVFFCNFWSNSACILLLTNFSCQVHYSAFQPFSDSQSHFVSLQHSYFLFPKCLCCNHNCPFLFSYTTVMTIAEHKIVVILFTALNCSIMTSKIYSTPFEFITFYNFLGIKRYSFIVVYYHSNALFW